MSDEYRRRGWWRDETFLDDLRRHTRDHPDKTAVVARRVTEGGPAGTTHTIDYAELSLLTDRCAGALVELGVEPGDTVAVQLDNRWELTVLALGCLRAGARICPLLPVYRRRELEVMLGLTEAAGLHHASPSTTAYALAELGVKLAASLPALRHVAVADGPESSPADTLDLHAHFFDTPWEDARTAKPSTPANAARTSRTWCCSPPAPPASPRAYCTARTPCTPRSAARPRCSASTTRW